MQHLLKPLRFVFLSAFVLAASPVVEAQTNAAATKPSWGPAIPAGRQYYYIPEINGFYDAITREYLIQRNGVGSWVRTSSVATSTASFHPVVMDYVGAKPWTLYDAYQAKYNKAAAATKPSWGPAIPAGRQYYYIPEINGFYDAITREYLIQRNGVGSWVRTSSVATSTASFHPVVMDYVGAKPWTLYDAYQAKYNKAKSSK